MRRRAPLLIELIITLGLLSSCAGGPPPRDCNNALNTDLQQCQGLVTPLATSAPAATSIPAFVQPAEYDGLMTEVSAYGVSIDGFKSTAAFSGTLETTDLDFSADVVNLSFDGLNDRGGKPIVIILKMDDSSFEQSGNYKCLKADGKDLGGTAAHINSYFFIGSSDEYVYVCFLPGHFVHNYSGWARFLTYDPALQGPIKVKSCPTITDCEGNESPATPTASTPEQSPTAGVP